MSYPVTVTIEPLLANRNRLTTAFRLILAIPHALLIGGIGYSFAWDTGHHGLTSVGGETGVLGTVAGILAVISWFTILFGGTHITGIRQFSTFYLRWRVRGLAYMMLLEDQYPPFGDEPYPAAVTVQDPVTRDRTSVALRLLLAIPHFIVLVFLLIGWWITAIIAWLLILVSGTYPQGMYDFGIGCLRWLIRLEAYMLLLVDEYPPFSFS
jgi:hypothetical protein